MHRILTYAVATILICMLAGCATFRGMGEDIKALGRGIENATK